VPTKLAFAVLLTLSHLSASVVYDLTEGPDSFQYTAPSFITTSTTVLAANLDSCTYTQTNPSIAGATCAAIDFIPASAEIYWTINLPGVGPVTELPIDFSSGAFTNLGLNQSTNSAAQLDITQTPEPSGLWLLAAALPVLGLARRAKMGGGKYPG
jgi:hypothetical protein